MNLCPLDAELELRYQGGKCRFMSEEKKRIIDGKEVSFGGKPMPDDLLQYVPLKNVSWLNIASQQEWKRLNLS